LHDREAAEAWRVVRFPVAPAELALRQDEVQVWHASLAPPDRYLPRLFKVLDAEERARADRFVFDRHRRRYVVAHGLLRHLLAGYLTSTPEAVSFERAAGGKPYLASHAAAGPAAGLRFNLAHSSDCALIAVSDGRELGIDLEAVRPNRDVVGIAVSFFSPLEVAALTGLPPDEQVAGFYRCWTRKEAYVKACGTGLGMRLDSFSVSLEPDASAALLEPGPDDDGRRWKMVAVAAGAGFDAALVVEGDDWRLVGRTLAFA
jgi:4'-phosphopantetheinyl transferase